MTQWNDDWDVLNLDDLLNSKEETAPSGPAPARGKKAPQENSMVSDEELLPEDFVDPGEEHLPEDSETFDEEPLPEDFGSLDEGPLPEDFGSFDEEAQSEDFMDFGKETLPEDFADPDEGPHPEDFTDLDEEPLPDGFESLDEEARSEDFTDFGKETLPEDFTGFGEDDPSGEETAFLPLEFLDLDDMPENSDEDRGLFSSAAHSGEDFLSEAAQGPAPGRQRPGQGNSHARGAGRAHRNAGKTADAGRKASSSRLGSAGRAGRLEEADDRSGRRYIPIHLILPVIIVIVAAVAVIRFAVWNTGIDIDIDSSANANRFNVEVNDSMVLLSSADQEGIVDDGITTVLCLGNEPFSADTSDTGLAAQIAELGDCTVINAAFPDSQVTCENATYTTDTLDDMDDIFNLFYVSYAIAIDDYTSLATVASAHEDETYANAVAALESTDFSTVDIIAIMYDGIDYLEGMAMYNEEVPEELTTYVGSLYNSIILLREAYPHIRIVFLSPYYAEYDGASARTTDLGNGTIVDYYQWAYDTCGSEGISFLDNYYGSINENNFGEYLNEDMSLNSEGATKIADHFVYKVIQGNYSEYNVEELAVAQ